MKDSSFSKRGFLFNFNERDLTASIIQSQYNVGCICIPRSVEYEGKNYIIRSIGAEAFNPNNLVKSIDFADDSEIQFIGKKAFTKSIIEKLSFPASLKELKEGWCFSANKLKEISISPKNEHFMTIDDKYIFCKSDEKSEKFDVLVFVNRNVTEETFPFDSVRVLFTDSYANCRKIETLDLSKCVNLRSIYCGSFNKSLIKKLILPASIEEFNEGWSIGNRIKTIEFIPKSPYFKYEKNQYLLGKSDKKSDIFDTFLFARNDIKKIKIPDEIEIINDYAFHECSLLKSIEFTDEEKLKIIGKEAFFHTAIEFFFIPSNVEEIGDSAFCNCFQLKKIEFGPNSKLRSINEKLFYRTQIEEISIPASITRIREKAFDSSQLCRINFPENSELKIIEKQAFYNTNLMTIKFPSNLIELGENCMGRHLLAVEWSSNSNIQIIGKASFNFSSINEIEIPSSVKIIDVDAFYACDYLQSINIPEDSKLECFGDYFICKTNIESIFIPQFLKELKEGWCDLMNLKNITVHEKNKKFLFIDNSFLIGKSDENSDVYDILHFARRDIENAIIPSYIKTIDSYAFYNCQNLVSVKFSEGSKLETIKKCAFAESSIEIFDVPPTLLKVECRAFYNCSRLTNIMNFENSHVKIIEDDFLCNNLTSVSFPSTFTEFRENWSNLSKLTNISVSPENKIFSVINNSLLVCKSDIKSDTFDVLVFGARNLKEVVIPSYIKKILSYAFNECKIEKLEFESNSQLVSIGNNSFSFTNIKRVIIPSSVQSIGNYAFSCCPIESLDFSPNSNLVSIGQNAFSDNSLSNLVVPNAKFIKSYAFYNSQNLRTCEFLGEEIEIENCIFSYTNILLLSFPNAKKVSSIKNILITDSKNLIVFISAGCSID